MIDSGALGTLTIGLQHVQRQEAADAGGPLKPPRPKRTLRSIRHGIAAILRRIAKLVEPMPVPAGQSPGVTKV